MRITSIFTLLMALAAGTPYAPCSAQTFSLGGKAGLSLSYITQIEKSETMKRLPNFGIAGGFTSNLAFSKVVSLQMELIFIQKGMRYKSTSVESRSRMYVNWVELPIMIQASFPVGETEMYVNAGGFFAVAINGRSIAKNDNGTGELETEKTDLDFGEGGLNRVDGGIPVGFGFLFKAGPGHLVLDFRYEIGLVDTWHSGAKPDNSKSSHWSCATASLAYLIPVGKQ